MFSMLFALVIRGYISLSPETKGNRGKWLLAVEYKTHIEGDILFAIPFFSVFS